MNIPVSARPNKLMAAMLAAGVVAASPALILPETEVAPALRTYDVQSASVVTDLLYDFGIVVSYGTSTITTTANLLASLPINALALVAAAAQDPAEIGSLLSFVVQWYLNPDYEPFYSSYAGQYASDLLSLASVLPGPLGSLASDLIVQLVDAVGNVFELLPDPTAGDDLMFDVVFNTVPGRVLLTLTALITGPIEALASVVDDVAFLPYDLEATLESAIRDPSEIPGLLSYLAAQVVADSIGLVNDLVLYPALLLPEPLGIDFVDRMNSNFSGLVADVVVAFYESVSAVFEFLPPPVVPTPFPSALPADENVEMYTLDVPAPDNDPASSELAMPTEDTSEESVDESLSEESDVEAEEIDEDVEHLADDSDETVLDDESDAAGDKPEVEPTDDEVAADEPESAPADADEPDDKGSAGSNDKPADTAESDDGDE